MNETQASQLPVYAGNDLGAVWRSSATAFRLWAPTACSAALHRFATGTDAEPEAADLGTLAMQRSEGGTWYLELAGDLAGQYYQYELQFPDGTSTVTADPYAHAAGAGGTRSMVLNQAAAVPDGWQKDERPAIPAHARSVWEVHVADFTADPASGVPQAYRGKFMGFTVDGTTLNGDGVHPTGLNYLKRLGVTHVQLQPIFDFATVDEVSGEDYNWTKELMSRIDHLQANGISLHCYTVPGDWEHKGSATDFSDEEYYITISKALHIEDIIEKHLAIMDEYDPNHDIDLLVDEWGTWYNVEPGTNPAFLYQQNTMRDAIVAAASLNIFNKHSDRIAMANIAQVVNVLQAMILTEDTKILKTPTYDVFQMYKEHQNATLVESYVADAANRINEPVISYNDISIPALSESVSVTEQNGQKLLTITLSNTSLTDSLSVELELPIKYSFCGKASVAMLHAEARAYNTFDDPDRVRAFETEEDWNGNLQVVSLPACSVCRICCYVS